MGGGRYYLGPHVSSLIVERLLPKLGNDVPGYEWYMKGLAVPDLCPKPLLAMGFLASVVAHDAVQA